MNKFQKIYQDHLKNKTEHTWVETYKCIICGKYHEAYLYEMNPEIYKSLQKELKKLESTK